MSKESWSFWMCKMRRWLFGDEIPVSLPPGVGVKVEVQGLGLRVEGWGLRVEGVGLRVEG